MRGPGLATAYTLATATALHRASLPPTGASMSCAPRPCTRVAIRTRSSARITANRCTSARCEDRATSLETRGNIVATRVTGARHMLHERAVGPWCRVGGGALGMHT